MSIHVTLSVFAEDVEICCEHDEVLHHRCVYIAFQTADGRITVHFDADNVRKVSGQLSAVSHALRSIADKKDVERLAQAAVSGHYRPTVADPDA